MSANSTYVPVSSRLLDEFSTSNRIPSPIKSLLLIETSISGLVSRISMESWVGSFSLSLSNMARTNMSCFQETCGDAITPPSVLLSDLEVEIRKWPEGWERGRFYLGLFF